jgi:hypothetical protein
MIMNYHRPSAITTVVATAAALAFAALVLPNELRAVNAQTQDNGAPNEPGDLVASPIYATDSEQVRNAKTTAKLDSILLPKVEFNNEPMDKAFEKLAQLSGAANPSKYGVSFGIAGSGPNITLSLANVTVRQTVELICRLTNYKYAVLSGTVDLRPATDQSVVLLSKTFDVPLHFFVFDNMPELNKGKDAALPDSTTVDVSDKLRARGIVLPDSGGGAMYYPKRQQVSVITTEQQLTLVEAMLKAATSDKGN